jgi:shikimate kinase/3-dehydroquinate synthase
MSGKTRVGKLLVPLLGLTGQTAFRDTDQLIEESQRKTVAEIFESRGEQYFRTLETALLESLLPSSNTGSDICTSVDPTNSANADASETELAVNTECRQNIAQVIALGGGTPIEQHNQQLLHQARLNGDFVVYLHSSPTLADARIAHKREKGDTSRPLLQADGEQVWRILLKEREHIYQNLCDLRIDSEVIDGQGNRRILEDWEIAEMIASTLKSQRIRVQNLSTHNSPKIEYSVVIGSDLTTQIPSRIAPVVENSTSKVAIIHTDTVLAHAQEVERELGRRSYDVDLIAVPDAEAAKTFGAYQQVLAQLAQLHYTRQDTVLGIGGGAVTDLTGFVASTYLRGIKCVNVPTSLLAMVDASTGGKTGINLEQGKNLVGAFYNPAAVWVDTKYLATLPDREYAQGLGEVAKIGFTYDSEILKLLESAQIRAGQRYSDAVINELIYRAVAVKAQVVANDFTEQGERKFLNYGHTFAHAIEKLENYSWRHGEAVAVGMIFAAELAYALNLISNDLLQHHYTLVEHCNLPTSWSTDCSFAQVLQTMKSDKKATSNAIRFVALSADELNPRITHPKLVAINESNYHLVEQVFKTVTR